LNDKFIVVLRVKIEMSSKHVSVNPLASAAASASASDTASAITNSSSIAHAAFTGGLSNSKTIPNRALELKN
jgi:hypothetical protein